MVYSAVTETGDDSSIPAQIKERRAMMIQEMQMLGAKFAEQAGGANSPRWTVDVRQMQGLGLV